MPTSSQRIGRAELNLVDLADISYAEYVNSAEEEADERFEQDRESFLAVARATARNRFGTASDQLQWTYTAQSETPTDVEEATAPLAPDRAEYLRYRYDHAGETASFELVQPCSACGESRVNEVTGLVDLGRFLAQGGTR